MLIVNFYKEVDDALLKYAVIVSEYNSKWVFCRHKERSTYECPGGHREPGEVIEATARRELWEETGAKDYELMPICVYSVTRDDEPETFGMLYFASITTFDKLPDSEIDHIELLDRLPKEWTYPEIQLVLLRKVLETILAS